MLDKVENRVPYGVSFRPGFQFFSGHVRFEGLCTPINRSVHYTGTIDLRPFGMDAIVHMNLRRGKTRGGHKLELLATGGKSLRQMGDLISRIFDVEPNELPLMRVDFASDLDGVTLSSAYGSIRVKFKRSTDSIGELDFETVGKRRLEYFRYGKAPNCVRVYDKPAECMARFPGLLKRCNPDAEPPSFQDLFGFAPNAIRTRVEVQSGGNRIPKPLSTFGDLVNASEINPFSRLEVVPNAFPFPDPKVCGVARSLKLAGIHACIERYGYQQTRATLNCDGNAKRLMDDYSQYLEETRATSELTLETIVQSYRSSVSQQIDGTIEDCVKGMDAIRPRAPQFVA